MDEKYKRDPDGDRTAVYEAWENALIDVRRLEVEIAQFGERAELKAAPSPELLEELSRLRKIADDRLDDIISMVRAEAHASASAPLWEPPD